MTKSATVSPFFKQCFVTLCTSLTLLNGGVIVSIIPILISQTKETLGFVLSDEQTSWFVSVISLAAIPGMLLVSQILNHYGRRLSVLTAATLVTIGWVFAITASCYDMLIASHILQGIGIGIASIVSPIYIGECVSPKHRAVLLTVPALFVNVGYFIGHFVSISYGWIKMAAISIILGCVNIVIIVFSPESPSMLAMRRKYEACRNSYHWLRGYDEEKELEELIKDVKTKSKDITVSTNFVARVKNILKCMRNVLRKDFYKPIVLTQLLYIINEVSGSHLFDPYAIDIIHNIVGKGCNVPAIIYSIDIQRLICSVLLIYIYKIFRRRVLLITFVSLNTIVVFLTAAYIYMKGDDENSFWYHSCVGTVLIHLLMLCYTMGTNPLPNVICGELLPLQYRNISTLVVTLSFYLTYFVHTKTFTSLVSLLGFDGLYCTYGFISSICFLLVLMYLPETKDRTLLDIETNFRSKKETNTIFEVEESANLTEETIIK